MDKEENIAAQPVQPAQRVAVTDIKMPFWSMVGFMVKLVIASIPAIIILAVLSFFVFGLLSAAFS